MTVWACWITFWHIVMSPRQRKSKKRKHEWSTVSLSWGVSHECCVVCWRVLCIPNVLREGGENKLSPMEPYVWYQSYLRALHVCICITTSHVKTLIVRRPGSQDKYPSTCFTYLEISARLRRMIDWQHPANISRQFLFALFVQCILLKWNF